MENSPTTKSELDQLEDDYAEYISFLTDVICELHDAYNEVTAYLEKGGKPLIENFNGVNKTMYLIL